MLFLALPPHPPPRSSGELAAPLLGVSWEIGIAKLLTLYYATLRCTNYNTKTILRYYCTILKYMVL